MMLFVSFMGMFIFFVINVIFYHYTLLRTLMKNKQIYLKLLRHYRLGISPLFLNFRFFSSRNFHRRFNNLFHYNDIKKTQNRKLINIINNYRLFCRVCWLFIDSIFFLFIIGIVIFLIISLIALIMGGFQ